VIQEKGTDQPRRARTQFRADLGEQVNGFLTSTSMLARG
jgi:hypothetical protein